MTDCAGWLMGLCVLLGACGSQLGGGSDIPPKYKAFFYEMTPERQGEVFNNASIEDQIDYYVASFKYEHPGRAGYRKDIARHGKAALPALLKRMREEKYPAGKFLLMYVLEEMHRTSYNLKDETEVLDTLKKEVAQMEDPRDRATGEEWLNNIEGEPGYQPQP